MPGEKKHLPALGSWDMKLKKPLNGHEFLYIIDSSDIGKNKDTLRIKKIIRKYKISYDIVKACNWQFEIK